MLTYELTAGNKRIGTIDQIGRYTLEPGVDMRLAGRTVRWAQRLLGSSPEVNAASYRTTEGVRLTLREIPTPPVPVANPLPIVKPYKPKTGYDRLLVDIGQHPQQVSHDMRLNPDLDEVFCG